MNFHPAHLPFGPRNGAFYRRQFVIWPRVLMIIMIFHVLTWIPHRLRIYYVYLRRHNVTCPHALLPITQTRGQKWDLILCCNKEWA